MYVLSIIQAHVHIIHSTTHWVYWQSYTHCYNHMCLLSIIQAHVHIIHSTTHWVYWQSYTHCYKHMSLSYIIWHTWTNSIDSLVFLHIKWRYNMSCCFHGFFFICSIMISTTTDSTMYICPTQFFCTNCLSCCSLMKTKK